MDTYAQQAMDLLPYLRRHARALTGSAEAGDRLVTVLLERMLDPMASRFETGTGQAEGDWYRFLHTLHDNEGRPRCVNQGAHPMERALDALPEEERRLYLLTSLDDFSLKEAAAILSLSFEEAAASAAEARHQLEAQLTADILVVEDDAIIAADLADTVVRMGHRLCGTAATMQEALTAAGRHRPTLALMDVRLAHGDSGIIVAQRLRDAFNLPVIFVTAFAEDIRKQGFGSLGPVISKPFTRQHIECAIAQAVFMSPPPIHADPPQPTHTAGSSAA